MKLDFHVHAALSKRIGLELPFFREAMRHAYAAGLDSVAITEHFDTINFDQTLPTLDQAFPYVGPHYEIEGVHVIPGLEMSVVEGPHLLAIGDRDALDAYRARLTAHLAPDGRCDTATFLRLRDSLDLLTIFAHPFRPTREIAHVDPALYREFDAVGLNGRDLYFFGVDVRDRTLAFAAQHGLPVVAGSDAHHYHQLGSVANVFDTDLTEIAEIKTAIAAGTYEIRIDPGIHGKVAAARAAKAAIKAQRLDETAPLDSNR